MYFRELLKIVDAPLLNGVQIFAAPCPIACHAPLSMECSRQEYWGGLSFPTPGHPPNPGIEPASPVSPALTARLFTTNAIWEAL